MVKVAKNVLVPYPARDMFALVDDVESYPSFLPWCVAASARDEGPNVTIATLRVDYHHIRQSFTTRNEKQPRERIDIRLEEGPFRHLQGHWRFQALDDNASRVEFMLEYEFATRLFDKLLRHVFHGIANSLVDAFVHRAEALYARRAP